MDLVKTAEKLVCVPTATIVGAVVQMVIDHGDPRQKKQLIRIDTVETDTSQYAKDEKGRWILEWYYGRYS